MEHIGVVSVMIVMVVIRKITISTQGNHMYQRNREGDGYTENCTRKYVNCH